MIVRATLWCGVILLVSIGVAAAVNRTLHVSDGDVRLELARRAYIPSFPPLVPDPAGRMRDVAQSDVSFAHHPALARLHVIAGAVFLELEL